MAENAETSIKLFVSSHKGGVKFPESDLVYPIEVGAALHKKKIEGILHDDEGENISEKNPRYCELTAQYWAWKNADADYYGFMHYRRYFSFNQGEEFETNHFGDILMDANDDNTLKLLGYGDDEKIRSIIEQYDLIVPQKGCFVDNATIGDAYAHAWEQHKEDLDCVLEIIDERHPEFSGVVRDYLNQTEGYYCNMFIMRKELFEDYSAWLFDILEEHERRRGDALDSYDVTTNRVSGYLAERLCGAYLTWLTQQGYRYTTLQRTLFANVDDIETLSPAFTASEKEPVAVVFSANDYYTPYLGALLKSIAENSSSKRNYDLIVLHEDFSAQNMALMREMVEAENISLRFLKVTAAMREYQDKLFLRGHFKVETYFRLLLPQLLPDYHKVLYLDADMINLHDVADLFDTDVENYLVAAVRDADTAGLYNGAPHSGTKMPKKEYMDTVLKIERPYDYFQAGTIVFNLDAWRETYTPEEIFAFASSNDWQLLDQDVLNYLCQYRVKFVDMAWNTVIDWRGMRINDIIKRAPRDIYFAYMESRKNPYVVHYAGPDKPWVNPESDMATYFWKYARMTPFYETALHRMAISVAAGDEDKPLSLKAKEFLYQKVAVPAVHKVLPEGSKGLEKARYHYRKIHPQRNED
ncbi:MAG: DUF4422 domain-containing protein [Olsenella sp.]|nr:DUF4422 domain-containing protein [Olsenella sp.]